MRRKAMPKLLGVYQIECLRDGGKYIGSSTDIRARWIVHKSALRNNKHPNKHLQAAWNNYGEDCLELSVLEHCTEEMLAARERFYIDTLKPKFNINPHVFDLYAWKKKFRWWEYT